MISGKRMYQGDTGELIRKCLTAEYEELRNLAPSLDPDVYGIVNKALAVDITQRYQSCSQMQSDIDDLLFRFRTANFAYDMLINQLFLMGPGP